MIFLSDGRLCRSRGHQVDHEAVRAHQQPLPLQHHDDDVTQLEDRIVIREEISIFFQTQNYFLNIVSSFAKP